MCSYKAWPYPETQIYFCEWKSKIQPWFYSGTPTPALIETRCAVISTVSVGEVWLSGVCACNLWKSIEISPILGRFQPKAVMHVGLPSLILISRVKIACSKQWGIQHWSQGEISFAFEYLVVKPHNFQNIQCRSDTLKPFSVNKICTLANFDPNLLFFRPIHLGCSSKMPVQKYTAEERGQRGTGSYKVEGDFVCQECLSSNLTEI